MAALTRNIMLQSFEGLWCIWVVWLVIVSVLLQETSDLSAALETAQRQLCETRTELNTITTCLEEERVKSSKWYTS